MKFKSDIEVQAGLKDSSGAIGTNGQLLSSTGSGVSWFSTNGFVPYTGAIANVDLGTHTLLSKNLVVNHPSGSGVAASVTKGGSGEALTVLKTSGSGNAASILGGVTLLDELHLNTDLADAYIASAANWNAAFNDKINSAVVTGTTTKTLTLNQQDGGTVTASWTDSDTAVTIGTANGLSLSGQQLSLGLASSTSNGALSSTDWNTFNNKLSSLSGAVLTTTDQSVAGVKTFTNLSKFTNNTGSFAVEIDTTATDALVVKNNGTTTLQISRSGEILGTKYRVSGGFASQFLKANGDLDSTVYTPASRTITINGVTQDLTANRSFTVATHDAVTIGTANGLSLSGQALSLALASGSTTGALSSTDWNTFNNKLSSLSGAVLTTTDQSITGTKTFNVSTSTDAVLINNTGGRALRILNETSGFGLIINNATSATAVPIAVQKAGASVFTLSDSGNIEASGFLNLGGGLYLQNNAPFVWGSTVSIIGDSSNNSLSLNTNTTPRLYINSSGNVGIGTTAPLTSLTVNGNLSLFTTNQIRLYNSAKNNWTQIDSPLLSGDTEVDFRVLTKTGSFYINASGNVGIGTTSPQSALHITASPEEVFRITRNGGADWAFGLGGSNDLYFKNKQNTTTPFCIVNGNVGIGTTSPGSLLTLYATTTPTIAFQNAGAVRGYLSANSDSNIYNAVTGNSHAFQCDSTERMRITSGGSVVVANLGTGLVYSNGGALTSTNPSDARLKDDITDLEYGLTEILQLRPVTYLWKNDTINQGKQFGFIAQEVEEIMPELVKEFETKDGEEDVIRLGLDKEAIFVSMVNAIKELQQQINELKNGN